MIKIFAVAIKSITVMTSTPKIKEEFVLITVKLLTGPNNIYQTK